MNNSEYEFILEDRLAKIRSINEQYDLEHNAYIAFSGGKDSTVLHHLIDLALPGNNIPRVFVNTGIEYNDLVKYVKDMASKDNRIVVLNNRLNIKKTLREKGYPFKSKEHSAKVNTYCNNQESVEQLLSEMKGKSIEELNRDFKSKYARRKGIDIALTLLGLTYNAKAGKIKEKSPFYIVPDILKYQFSRKVNDMPFKISDKCCLEFKEKPMLNWAKENSRMTAITGLMKEEGGRRTFTKCTVFAGEGKLKSFAPMSVLSKEFEEEFIERERIILCKLYYSPYNFCRTGCKGCPFSLSLEDNLMIMKILLPKEYKQCLHLWKPVYDEYIRLKYRLKKYPSGIGLKLKLFDTE